MTDFAAVKSSLNLAYLAILAMLVVPNFYLVHPYLHLLIIAPILVWTGCQRSLLESQKSPEDSQVCLPPGLGRRQRGERGTQLQRASSTRAHSFATAPAAILLRRLRPLPRRTRCSSH